LAYRARRQVCWYCRDRDHFVFDTAAGNNAIIITFDEGNTANSQIVTIVVTNHGPGGVTDKTSFNHYFLLARLQQTFGLGCLLNSRTANPMTSLFAITGSTSTPSLPPALRLPDRL